MGSVRAADTPPRLAHPCALRYNGIIRALLKGQDLEDAVLELLPKGRVPLESHLFGVMGGVRPNLCLADTSFVVDRPPTHFFVKKKFIPIGGAETATQKVSSVFGYAHTLCGEGLGYDARNPSVRATAYRRHPCQHSTLIDALCVVKMIGTP